MPISRTRCARCGWRCLRPMLRCRSSNRSSRRIRERASARRLARASRPARHWSRLFTPSWFAAGQRYGRAESESATAGGDIAGRTAGCRQRRQPQRNSPAPDGEREQARHAGQCRRARPAAILQLQTLARRIGALALRQCVERKTAVIVDRALDESRRSHADVLIVDTAGRLHVDGDMMDEVAEVHAKAQPHETIFVVDSMAGQDAVNSRARSASGCR